MITIDKNLLNDQIDILAEQLNKPLSEKERDAIEGLLNLLGDIGDYPNRHLMITIE